MTLGDLALFSVLGAENRLPSWEKSEKETLVNICRWYDLIQHLPELQGVLDPKSQVEFVLDLPKAVPKTGAPKEKKPVEKTADSKDQTASSDAPTTSTNTKPKQESKPKGKKAAAPAAPAVEEGTPMSRVELRVGRIVECIKHPEADSLYIEKIDLGEPTGPRTIVSGLVKFVPLDQMQNRLVVVVANLKPSKLKGVESAGMVLAASNSDHTEVQIIDPPANAVVGERVTFTGHDGAPDAQLNPKKKIWDGVKEELRTDASCIAMYRDIPFMTSAGPCRASTLANSTIG